MAHVQTNSFPPSTKVFLYPPGTARPEQGLESGDSAKVTKDGTVAFDVKNAGPGEFVWLAGELEDGSWLAVMCSVKDGKKGDAADPAGTLAGTTPYEPPQEPETELQAQARKEREKQAKKDAAKAKRDAKK